MYISRKKIVIVAALAVLSFLFAGRRFVLDFLPDETRHDVIGPRLEGLSVAAKKIQDWPYLFYRLGSHTVPVYTIIIDPAKIHELDEYYLEEKDNYDRKTIYKKALFVGDDGVRYDVKVTYRGDQEAHLTFPKKSWRVVFEDDKLFRNTKAINLIIPEDRLFFVEELNHYRAKKMGLVAPESRFVFLQVNGRNVGVYWEAEQWGKEMLEKQQLSGDTNLYGERGFGSDALYQDITAWTKYVESPLRRADDRSDLKLFLDTLNAASDQYFYENVGNILDLDIFYRWQAHAVLAGGRSQDHFHNARLYFDPAAGRFIVIPWDVNLARLDDRFKTAGLTANPISRRIITSPRLLFASNLALWEYVRDEKNLKDDLTFYDETYRTVQGEFYRDALKNFTNGFFRSEVAKYRAMIADNFNTARQLLAANDIALSAEINPAQDRNTLNAAPLFAAVTLNKKGLSPVDVLGLGIKNLPPGHAGINAYYDANQNRTLDFGDRQLGAFAYAPETKGYTAGGWDVRVWTTLAEREYRDGTKAFDAVPSEATIFVTAGLPAEDAANAAINIQLRNAVTGETFDREVKDVAAGGTFAHFADISQRPDQFVARHPIFVKTGPQTLSLGPGNFVLRQTVVIPKAVELTVAAGTTLYLAPGVSLVSYGPVQAVGRADAKIRFLPLDPEAPWGTIAIIGAPGESRFIHTQFRHQGALPPPADQARHALSAPPINGIAFRGMLSVFHSDLYLEKSELLFSAGDDGLNAKYGRVEIRENSFHGNSADALDVDVASGLIAGNVFRKNGNDAIDVSGADLTIRENVITQSVDKGISIGEKSNAVVFNNAITKSGAGIAVKDSSRVDIVNNVVVENAIGVHLYRNKAVFNGGEAALINSIVWGNGIQIQKDDLSGIGVVASTIEGGWDDADAIDVEPVFNNAAQGDYRLAGGKNPLLLGAGNAEAVRKYLDFPTGQAPIGLIAQ